MARNPVIARLMVCVVFKRCRTFKQCRSPRADLPKNHAQPVQACWARNQSTTARINMKLLRKIQHVNASPHIKSCRANQLSTSRSGKARLRWCRLWAASSPPGAHLRPHPCTASSTLHQTVCASRTSGHAPSLNSSGPLNGRSPSCSPSSRYAAPWASPRSPRARRTSSSPSIC